MRQRRHSDDQCAHQPLLRNAPENIKADLISALKSEDGWSDVDGSSDQLKKSVSATYDMREVDGVDNLVGTYNFGPSDDAASGATA